MGGEDTERVEAELLAEDDEEEGEVSFNLWLLFNVLTKSIENSLMRAINTETHKAKRSSLLAIDNVKPGSCSALPKV